MTNPTDDDPPVELSSPACAMHEADDAYMGYAGKDELVAFLNALLEAEGSMQTCGVCSGYGRSWAHGTRVSWWRSWCGGSNW
jgi:hypothetical protein